MDKWHEGMEKRIRSNLKDKYLIEISSEANNNLPIIGRELTESEIMYNPDVIVLDKSTEELIGIVEIEHQTEVSTEFRYKLVFSNFSVGIMKLHNSKQRNIIFVYIIHSDKSEEKYKRLRMRMKFTMKFLKNISESYIILEDNAISEVKRIFDID